MCRQLILAAAILASTHSWAQGVFPYPTKGEVSKTLTETRDVLHQFDELMAHLNIDSWNAPAEFRARQKLLLSDAQEGLNDVRDEIEHSQACAELNSGALSGRTMTENKSACSGPSGSRTRMNPRPENQKLRFR